MIRRRIWGVVAASVTPLCWGATALAQGDPGAAAPPPPAAGPGAGAAAADSAAADLAGADEPSPSRPPPAGKGAVWGVVRDASTSEPVLDAQVSVVGTKLKAIADLDGRYRLELPPGNYQLRVWYEAYKPQRVQDVQVAAGQVAQVDVGLEPDQQAEEVIEVEFEPERASVAAQLLLRKNAAHVGDAVGAKEIARTPDRNAAEAAKRIVGATVVDGRYVYVRGLGERYTNALLNGAPLPSPEPDRQAVPLDLFPSLVLSDITVVKTFTPDIPGDFAGGSVQINTRELPTRFLFQASLSLGLNSQATFRDRLTYAGSSTDWLGIDDGTRAVPDEIPDYKVVRLGPKPGGGTITRDEMTAYGRAINSPMATKRSFTPPNGSGSVVVGDTLELGGEQRLGYVATLSYGRKFSARADELLGTYRPAPDGGEPVRRGDIRTGSIRDQVSWGSFASVTYNPGADHKVTLTGLHSRSSDDVASEASGEPREGDSAFRDTLLRFISRALTLGQLQGEHRFEALGGGTLDWKASISAAASEEPDTREAVYIRDDASGAYSWDEGTLSGAHFFNDMSDVSYGGQLSYVQPLLRGDAPTRLKLGGLLNVREREFNARRFRFKQRPGSDPTLLRQGPDRLFSDENIGTALELEEITRETDSYTASGDLFAGYVMTDTALTPWLRAVLGARVEASALSLRAFDRYSAANPEINVDSDEVDLLPALNIIVKSSSISNVRLGAARTLARPQLRELSPFLYQEGYSGREVQGNPDLRRTSVVNGDLRFEIFPTAGEVAAISLFYKHFQDPIEEVIVPNGARGRLTYVNGDVGHVAGVELELRKGLGFISPFLADATALGNITFVSSEVTIDPGASAGGVTIQSNATHPLQGQSPFVVNLGLDYARESTGTSARLLYNVFGARLKRVGSRGLPDEYEQPRHQIDLTVAQRLGERVELKLAGENLIDAPVRVTQGKEDDEDSIVSHYRVGTTVTLSAALTY
ncbi:TonB-dependent receptor [Sorangium cellulosum]|uniref:TonB-dependent receptor n=1 Tax=Sorangium cellulosum TaxID=56 RepID=A0A4P2Q4C2_SORCE|nr:TonB-dependent receptor [Sorangium cellulosum]AUX24207.1 TonB-dependent receptor [Sorangium cellulosum]